MESDGVPYFLKKAPCSMLRDPVDHGARKSMNPSIGELVVTEFSKPTSQSAFGGSG